MQTSSVPQAKSETKATDVAKVAGRGTIYITIAKLWFMASGAIIYFILPRLMTKEQVGAYQVVTGIVSIINAVIVTGTYQTVSKYISQEEHKADSVKAKALRLQVAVGGALTLAFFLLAPVIANNLNDASLTGYLRLASLIPLSYSFYSVFTGYFNGQKKFMAQAALDMSYSTLKFVLIVALAWLGYGVAGGIAGFALAAGIVLLLSAIIARGGARRGEVRASDLFRFQAYLLLFTFVLNLLQKVDLILVKALSSADSIAASENAAYYGAAINVANITYQVIISVTFVIFPLVSQSTFADDRRQTKAYISNTLRYSLMIMALLATLFSANAREVLQVVYPLDYQPASAALVFIAYGMLLFGMFQVITTIISASGRPAVSLGIAALTLATSAALNYALIPSCGLAGAGLATTIAMFVGVIAGGGYLLARFGALMPLWSFARIAFCAGLVYAASLALALQSKMIILVQLAALSLVYFAALVFTKEIGRGDLEAIKKVFRK